MQAPGASREAALPETLQTDGVAELKLTGRPELTEALRLRDEPVVWAEITRNVMVCDCTLEVNDCETGVAGA